MRDILTLNKLKRYSFEKIEHLQNLRFRATCRYLLPNTAFYSKLFKSYRVDPFKLCTVNDWHTQGLPLIKKATYLKNPRDFIVNIDKKEIAQVHLHYLNALGNYNSTFSFLLSSNKETILKEYYHPKMLIFSGGTETGNPTPVFLSAPQKFTNLKNIIAIIGELLRPYLPPKKTGMNLFPYAPHLGWHAVHQALDQLCDLNLNTAAGGTIPTERLVDLAHHLKPTILCGMASYLKNRFLPLAIKKKITLSEHILFINGAQKILQTERIAIEQLARQLGAINVTVLDLYAASELKEALLPECRPERGYHHIAPLSTIIKTVNATRANENYITEWEFTPNGYATSWNIDGAGTLLCGYLIGDRFDTVTTTPCTNCGLSIQRIFGINRIKEVEAQLTLTGTVEEKIKGTRVNLVSIRETALSLPEVREAQVQLNKGQLTLAFVSDTPKQTKQHLAKLFATEEIQPRLVSTTLDKLQGKKIKFQSIQIL